VRRETKQFEETKELRKDKQRREERKQTNNFDKFVRR
jgi:hypothetical protein